MEPTREVADVVTAISLLACWVATMLAVSLSRRVQLWKIIYKINVLAQTLQVILIISGIAILIILLAVYGAMPSAVANTIAVLTSILIA